MGERAQSDRQKQRGREKERQPHGQKTEKATGIDAITADAQLDEQ